MIDVAEVERRLDEISRCRTLNEFNRVHIQIEIHCSPAEVCAIIDAVRERGIPLLPNLQRWHAIMDEQLRGTGGGVEPYVRTPVAPGATMYAAPATPAERARRTLVIAFTGIADRLMMPVSSFLQHCRAADYEFLVLFDRSRSNYLAGVAGVGETLSVSIDALRARIASAGYRRAITFGTSGGGLAAVWTAVELELERAVSVGGATPATLASMDRATPLDASGFEEAIRRHAGRLPETVYMAGEHAQRDREKARETQALLPTTTLVVPGCDDHNTLHYLRRRGELAPLLARLFGGGPATLDATASGAR